MASTFVGTIAYWPPERFDSKVIEGEYRYDVRSDIWSLGVTLTEIAYGKLPFLDEHGQPLSHENNSQSNIVTVQKWILNLDINELINRCLGQFYSNECVGFIRWCLEKLPNRPKYDALMETPFYQKFKNSVCRKDMSHFIQTFEYIWFFSRFVYSLLIFLSQFDFFRQKSMSTRIKMLQKNHKS